MPLQLKNLLAKISPDAKLAILIVLVAKTLVFTVGVPQTPCFRQVQRGFLRCLIVGMLRTILRSQKTGTMNTGDPANFIVFFPLYPILVRLITFNFDDAAVSAFLVANVCSFVAFFYLYKLAKLEFDSKVAVKAVLFMSIFPTAYFCLHRTLRGCFLRWSSQASIMPVLAGGRLRGFLACLRR